MLQKGEPMNDVISRQAAIDTVRAYLSDCCVEDGDYHASGIEYDLNNLPSAQPEQLEQCPIYGGMCAYPSDQCYDCPRHAGAKMEVTE